MAGPEDRPEIREKQPQVLEQLGSQALVPRSYFPARLGSASAHGLLLSPAISDTQSEWA